MKYVVGEIYTILNGGIIHEEKEDKSRSPSFGSNSSYYRYHTFESTHNAHSLHYHSQMGV
jgi:hypothetical protein